MTEILTPKKQPITLVTGGAGFLGYTCATSCWPKATAST